MVGLAGSAACILLGGTMRMDRIDRHDCSVYMNEWAAILYLGSRKGMRLSPKFAEMPHQAGLGHLARFLSSMGIVGRQ